MSIRLTLSVRLALLMLGLVACPQVALARQDTGTPPRRFDAEFGYLSFSWVGRPSDSFALGPEIGAGFLQQVVMAPSGDDLTGLAHVGVVSTLRLGSRVDLDLGVRAGMGELRSVACAGCGFSGYYGLTAAMFVGSRRVRFGTRLMGGKIEGGSLTTWSPVAVRVQF